MDAVLVVEDDAIIRLGAVGIVEDAGLMAVEAVNADQAISILEARTDIGLVFTDIDMPGSMDGVKLAHYVRHRWPPIHIVVASGKAIVEESELPPGSRFFSKPYSDRLIAHTLRRMITSGPAS